MKRSLATVQDHFQSLHSEKIDPQVLSALWFFLLFPEFFLLFWGLTTCQSLLVILCRLPEKGRREIEEKVEMKERDRGKEDNGWKWRNRRNKNIYPLPLPAARIAGLASQYRWRKIRFPQEKVSCGYSLEAPTRSASNEYPQHMFHVNNEYPKHLFSWRTNKIAIYCGVKV